MAELTEYEKQRAARVARNQQLLAELQLSEAAKEFASELTKPEGKTKKSTVREFQTPDGPIRRSARIQRSGGPRRPLIDASSGDESGSDGDEDDGGQGSGPSGSGQVSGDKEEEGSGNEEEEYEPMADEEDSEGVEAGGEEEEEEEGEGHGGSDQEVRAARKGNGGRNKMPRGSRRDKGSAARRFQEGQAWERGQTSAPRGGQTGLQALTAAQASLVAHVAAAAAQTSTAVDEDEDEIALQQALALSLGESVAPRTDAGSTPSPSFVASLTSAPTANGSPAGEGGAAGSGRAGATAVNAGRKDESAASEGAKWQQDKAPVKRSKGRSQPRKRKRVLGIPALTPSEVDAVYFLFDERGRGDIRPTDVARVASGLDFHWSEEEVHDMVALFDQSGKGKLRLPDFHGLVKQCSLSA